MLVRLRDPVTGKVDLYPPGGGVDPGESPAETARRETLEETGVRVRVAPSIVVVLRYPFLWGGVDYDCTTHFFAAVPESPPEAELPSVVDADYNLGALWLPTAEALEALDVHPPIADAARAVLEAMRGRSAEAT